MNTFTIRYADWSALLTPVLPHADDGSLPVLGAVHFESRGDYLVASATDRYTAGAARFKVPGTKSVDALVDAKVLRACLTAFRPDRKAADSAELVVTFTDTTMNVEGSGALFDSARVSYPRRSGEYPKIGSIFDQAMKERAAGTPVCAVNPRHLAKFHVAARPGEPLIVRSEAPTKPLLITVGDYFAGVLMPIPSAPGMGALPDWSGMFPTTEKVNKGKGAAA